MIVISLTCFGHDQLSPGERLSKQKIYSQYTNKNLQSNKFVHVC